MIEGRTTLRGAGITYRAVLLPLSDGSGRMKSPSREADSNHRFRVDIASRALIATLSSMLFELVEKVAPDRTSTAVAAKGPAMPPASDWNRAHPGVVSATSRENGMIKQVFAGVVAIGSVAGVASAQTYISMSPPPAAFAPPWVVGASPPTTTTTAASSRNSDQREVTIQDVVNRKGNTSAEQDLLAGPP
jgi:hypothetical protein